MKNILNENPKSGFATNSASNRRGKSKWPFYGWVIALAATLLAFLTGPGQAYVFSVFVDPILSDTGLSRTELSFLYSIGTGFSAVMAWLVSRLVARFGARLMLGLIALAFGGACFVLAWATNSFGFLVGFAVLRALGQGSLPLVAGLLIVQWFDRYRGRAMALFTLGFPASNALFPLVCQWLIGVAGWRDAYRLLGIATWLWLMPLAIFVIRDRPEKLGLHPDGLVELPVEGAAPSQVKFSHQSPPVRRIWRSWSFWQIALALSASPFVVTALVFHQSSILAERNLAAETSAGIFVVLAITSALATVVTGFILERVPPKNVLLANLAILLIAILSLLWVHDLFSAVVYTVLLGIGMGSQSVIAGVIWAYYYGRERVSVYLGAAAIVLISSPALAPVLLAALQQVSGDYSIGLLGLAGLPLACALFLAGFRLHKH